MTPLSPKTLDFLFENRLHDSKAWFEEHREDYRRLVAEPLTELTEALAPCLLAINPNLITDPRRVISRIRRDTRFTKDKSLYRDNMWLSFKHHGAEGLEAPEIYFAFSGDGFEYGCGCYSASPAAMETLRQLVLSGHPDFKAAQKALDSQDVFHLCGDFYKRPRCPGKPEALRGWLERKNLYVGAESKDFALLFSEKLAEKLCEDFKLLAPAYRFLMTVAEVQFKQSTAMAAR